MHINTILPIYVQDALLPFLQNSLNANPFFSTKTIQFSNATYHIECISSKKSEWVFVTLNPQENTPEDIFCSCSDCIEHGVCEHMAAALVAIYAYGDVPLHTYFYSSPFGILSKEYFNSKKNVGTEDTFKIGPLTITGDIFALKKYLTTEEAISEENGIQFAAASEEELRDYQHNTISQRLAYELSPLTDACKFAFIEHCKKPSKYSLSEAAITFIFEHFSFSFSSISHTSNLLDSLLFYPSSESIHLSHFGGKEIQTIQVHPLQNSFSLIFSGTPISFSQKNPTIALSWRAVSKNHFVKTEYENTFPLSFLGMFASKIPKIALQYAISIDTSGMTIEIFLQKETDQEPEIFSTKGFIAYKGWLFENDSVYRSGMPRVPLSGKKVPYEDVSDFIDENPQFLSFFPQYTLFSSPTETTYTYSVNDTDSLTIRGQNNPVSSDAIIFSRHIYVPNTGFFPKKSSSLIPDTIHILPHKIGFYIEENRSFLQTIPNFFAKTSPITSISLTISYTKKSIHVRPFFHYESTTDAKTVRIYGTYGFIQNIGFFSLPMNHEMDISQNSPDEWDRFFLEKLPFLQSHFSCTISTYLTPPEQLQLNFLSKETESILHTCSAHIYWESSFGKVTPEELFPFYKKQLRFAPTSAGLIDLYDKRFSWLATITPSPKKNQPYTLHSSDIVKISQYDTINIDPHSAKTAIHLLQKLLDNTAIPPLNLSLLQSTLRPYQQDGVLWLWRLYHCSLSGLLCDDMGVGKTHQALALLAAIIQRQNSQEATAEINTCSKKYFDAQDAMIVPDSISCIDSFAKGYAKKPFLLICPTSLLHHWKEKITALLPTCTLWYYVGTDRHLPTSSDSFDILLTTYGIFRGDVSYLSLIPFEVAFFDEVQLAKNHFSQLWAALAKINAVTRIGLTGTPIENNVRELQSLFDLVLPGYFPSELISRRQTIFSHYFDHATIISAYTKPFILRRKKQDVLHDLPIKTETVLHVELHPEQKDLYRSIAANEGTTLLSLLQDTSSPIPYMHIFALISTLKTVCNHPAIYAKDIENYAAYSSGKWDAFIELLEESIQSNEKVVVFSHSLPMLDIMERHLQTLGIQYGHIRGSTKNRGEEILRFRNDPNCMVFIASLMAGGLGIDLTAGSIVIHYDRWWNAARENQATDRVHRLGQVRGVNVYKLMTLSTIEERIDQIISSKASLLEAIVGFDDHRILKNLSREELLSLLHEFSSS